MKKKYFNIKKNIFIVIFTTVIFFFIGLFVFENNKPHYEQSVSKIFRLNIIINDIFEINLYEKNSLSFDKSTSSFLNYVQSWIVAKKMFFKYEKNCEIEKIDISNTSMLIQIMYDKKNSIENVKNCNKYIEENIRKIYNSNNYKIFSDSLVKLKMDKFVFLNQLENKSCINDFIGPDLKKKYQLLFYDNDFIITDLEANEEFSKKNYDFFIQTQNLINEIKNLYNLEIDKKNNYERKKYLLNCEMIFDDFLIRMSKFEFLRKLIIEKATNNTPNFIFDFYIEDKNKNRISGLQIKSFFAFFGFLLSLIIVKFYPFKA